MYRVIFFKTQNGSTSLKKMSLIIIDLDDISQGQKNERSGVHNYSEAVVIEAATLTSEIATTSCIRSYIYVNTMDII